MLAVVAVGLATYVAYAHPYGGVLAYFAYGLYFAAALALIWIGDRLIRSFRKPS